MDMAFAVQEISYLGWAQFDSNAILKAPEAKLLVHFTVRKNARLNLGGRREYFVLSHTGIAAAAAAAFSSLLFLCIFTKVNAVSRCIK
jgi:hypothetical protein